jgi:hypothetical protein
MQADDKYQDQERVNYVEVAAVAWRRGLRKALLRHVCNGARLDMELAEGVALWTEFRVDRVRVDGDGNNDVDSGFMVTIPFATILIRQRATATAAHTVQTYEHWFRNVPTVVYVDTDMIKRSMQRKPLSSHEENCKFKLTDKQLLSIIFD